MLTFVRSLSRPSPPVRALAAVGYLAGLVVAVLITRAAIVGDLDPGFAAIGALNALCTLGCGLVAFAQR